MNLIMREACESDIEEFNVLMDQLSHRASSNEILIKQINKSLNNPDMFLMVAEDTDTGRLCGSMLGLLCEDFCDDCKPILFIENVVTDKDYRRKGITKKIFDAMEEWGRSKNVNYAVLCSGLSRVEAHKFYDNIGYSEVKGYKKYL